MFYAQLDEDICVAVTQAAAEIQVPNLIALDSYDASVLGKRYNADTGDFEDAPQPAPTPTTVLTKLQFRNRFTLSEKAAIEFAALDDPSAPTAQRQQSAMLRAVLADHAAAEHIDLADQSTIDGVHLLVQAGLLTAERGQEVLTP